MSKDRDHGHDTHGATTIRASAGAPAPPSLEGALKRLGVAVMPTSDPAARIGAVLAQGNPRSHPKLCPARGYWRCRVQAFSGAALSALDAAQTAALKTTQIAALTNTQIGGLNATDIGELAATQVAALTSTQVGGLTNAAASALDSDQIAALNATQVKAFTATQITLLGHRRRRTQRRANRAAEHDAS